MIIKLKQANCCSVYSIVMLIIGIYAALKFLKQIDFLNFCERQIIIIHIAL